MDKRNIFMRSIKQQSVLVRSHSGFTYVGLLILVAIMGVTLAGIGTVWRTAQQRVKEQQLLFIGNQFSMAITAYYLNSPGGALQFPKKLEDLLLDKRYPNTTRYLRKIFADPVTGSTKWGLIKGADGNIVGVHSMSELAPVKLDNFGTGNESLAGKMHYSEWQFTYRSNAYTALAATAAPANPVPAAYRVPPPDPLPAEPTADQRKLRLCQTMRVTDASTCAQLATKFDNVVGAACMASANERFTICTRSENAMLPPLIVQYK